MVLHGAPINYLSAVEHVLSNKPGKTVWHMRSIDGVHVKVSRFKPGYKYEFDIAVNGAHVMHGTIPNGSPSVLFCTCCTDDKCLHPHWLVEQYVHGIDMGKWLKQNNHCIEAQQRVIRRFERLFSKIQRENVIHGDLKFENIIVGQNERVWLIDNEFTVRQTHVFDQNDTWGTLAMLSPEQLFYHSCPSLETDAWQYGIILYQWYAKSDLVRASDYVYETNIKEETLRTYIHECRRKYKSDYQRLFASECPMVRRYIMFDQMLIRVQLDTLHLSIRKRVEPYLAFDPCQRKTRHSNNKWCLFC